VARLVGGTGGRKQKDQMSLRKSPTRTPAFLAANRANAQKCTGPRTPEAKTRVAFNALRHGLKARSFFSFLAKSRRASEEFSGLYRALYAALLPDKTDEAAMDLLKRMVLHVWVVKQRWMRWAASPEEREAWFARTGGVCPAPSQWLIERPGWRVRVSVWVRWGRARGRRRWLQPGPFWKERRARLHVVVTVTASNGHPLRSGFSLEDVGVASRLAFQTKPECARKQKGNKNVIGPSRIHRNASRERRARAEVAPERDRDDPISCHIASARGDLLFWLRPENAALTGPRLSESEDIERWIDAIVTKWAKQHGPIPRKEVMPHESTHSVHNCLQPHPAP
jgi:hypothetical protein